MERLNRILVLACLNNRFISFFLSMIHPQSGEVQFCNAGHNPPLLVRKDGKIEWLEGGGPVLGILPDISYTEEFVKLEKRDVVVFYSDGVTEANNPLGEEYGEKRLAEFVQMSPPSTSRPNSTGAHSESPELDRRRYRSRRHYPCGRPKT